MITVDIDGREVTVKVGNKEGDKAVILWATDWLLVEKAGREGHKAIGRRFLKGTYGGHSYYLRFLPTPTPRQ